MMKLVSMVTFLTCANPKALFKEPQAWEDTGLLVPALTLDDIYS